MKIIDFVDRKKRRAGIVTVKEIAEEIQKLIESGKVESLCYIARMDDEEIYVGWSDIKGTEAVGLFQIGVYEAFREMRE